MGADTVFNVAKSSVPPGLVHWTGVGASETGIGGKKFIAIELLKVILRTQSGTDSRAHSSSTPKMGLTGSYLVDNLPSRHRVTTFLLKSEE
jgi:hypothetical protein